MADLGSKLSNVRGDGGKLLDASDLDETEDAKVLAGAERVKLDGVETLETGDVVFVGLPVLDSGVATERVDTGGSVLERIGTDGSLTYGPINYAATISGAAQEVTSEGDILKQISARGDLTIGPNQFDGMLDGFDTAEVTPDGGIMHGVGFDGSLTIGPNCFNTMLGAFDVAEVAPDKSVIRGVGLDGGMILGPTQFGAMLGAFDVADVAPDGSVMRGVRTDGAVVSGAHTTALAIDQTTRTANGAVLGGVDEFGVEIQSRDYDAWVSGGNAYAYARGETVQLTADAAWIKSGISGGQIALVNTDGTRTAMPLSGTYPVDGFTQEIEYFDVYGQSNAAGNASATAENDTAFSDRAMMFGGGQRTFGNALQHDQERQNAQIEAYDAIHNFVPGYEQLIGSAGETPCSGLAWGLLEADNEVPAARALVTTCSAVGSANPSMLLKDAAVSSDDAALNTPGVLWENLEAKFIRARLFWAMQNRRFIAGGLLWNQGEGNISDSKATYLAYLETLRDDWQSLASGYNALRGAGDGGFSGKAPIIVAQTCNGNNYSYSTSEVPWAQLQVNLDDPETALCLGPLYDQDHAADGVHLSALGQEMQGARAAYAYNAWLRGENWKPLYVVSAVRAGSTVTLTIYNHDSLPLTFDTTTITGLGADQGFVWGDDGDGNTVTVSTATVINATTVELSLDAVPTGSNGRIDVAMNGTPAASAGPATGNRSTLRTNGSGITTRGGRAVEHFVCIDRVPVTT